MDMLSEIEEEQMPDPGDDDMPDDLKEERPATPERESDDEQLTAEFDILEAGLDREIEPIESENPRDKLSPEELAKHVEALDSVAKARARASSVED